MKINEKNTVFLTVAAWPDWERQLDVFLRSARKRSIPVELLDRECPWNGYYQHKIVRLRDTLLTRQKERPNIRYIVFTDSRDVVYVKTGNEIIRLLDDADDEKVLFALDNKLKTWPMNRTWLAHRIALKYDIDGVLNSGCYAGRIDRVIDLLTECIHLHEKLATGNIAHPSMEAMIQAELLPEYLNSDQFHMHAIQALWSDLIAVDVRRKVFACFKGGFPTIRTAPELVDSGVMPIGTAGILHSPWMLHRNNATIEDKREWHDWAVREGIIDEHEDITAQGRNQSTFSSRYQAFAHERPPSLDNHAKIHPRSDWTWAIGMTTSDRPQPTLAGTLESFRGTGFVPPHVFYDSEKHCGIWNFHRTLSYLVETSPNADAYVVMEDDIVFARNIRSYLEEELWAEIGENGCICSLFTPTAYLSDEKWKKSGRETSVYMSQFRIYHPITARQLVEDIPKLANFESHERQTDRIISRWAAKKNVGIWFHSPSLVQHVGLRVTSYPTEGVRNYELGVSRNFVGENFIATKDNIDTYIRKRPPKASLPRLDITTSLLTNDEAAKLASILDRYNCDLEKIVVCVEQDFDPRQCEQSVNILRSTGKVPCVSLTVPDDLEVNTTLLKSFADEIVSMTIK